MPKLIGSATLLLALLLSGLAHAQPPYGGTVFIDPGILTPADPSAFILTIASGTGQRTMFDRRNGGQWITNNATLFQAHYTDSTAIEIQVNSEIEQSEAAALADFYGHAVGQLPRALRVDVETMWIHRGDEAFGGGNNNILIHTDAAGYHGQWLEETLFHEACHTSLDSRVANESAWLAAQAADLDFISSYASDFPMREDVAESCLPYFAVRYRDERISQQFRDTVNVTMPNRMTVLDSFAITPVVAADRVAAYDGATQQLHLPGVKAGSQFYELQLDLHDLDQLLFSLASAVGTEPAAIDSPAEYLDGLLQVPVLRIGQQKFSLVFSLAGTEPVTLRLESYQELQW